MCEQIEENEIYFFRHISNLPRPIQIRVCRRGGTVAFLKKSSAKNFKKGDGYKFGFIEMLPLTRRAGRPLPAAHQHTNCTFKFGVIGELIMQRKPPSS